MYDNILKSLLGGDLPEPTEEEMAASKSSKESYQEIEETLDKIVPMLRKLAKAQHGIRDKYTKLLEGTKGDSGLASYFSKKETAIGAEAEYFSKLATELQLKSELAQSNVKIIEDSIIAYEKKKSKPQGFPQKKPWDPFSPEDSFLKSLLPPADDDDDDGDLN